MTDFEVAILSRSADSGRKVVHKRRVYSGSPWNVDKCWVVVCYKFGPHSWATARRVCNLDSAFHGLPVNFHSQNHAHKVVLRGANRAAPINHWWYMFQASNCLWFLIFDQSACDAIVACFWQGSFSIKHRSFFDASTKNLFEGILMEIMIHIIMGDAEIVTCERD